MPGTFSPHVFPATEMQRKQIVSNPGMHVGIATPTLNFMYLAKGPINWAVDDKTKKPKTDSPSRCVSPLPTIHTYIHTCLLLISMLWHRQPVFESKGDKLSSSAECRIRTHQGLRHQIASRMNARWQTDWAIEDQAKNLNSTARPYDQRTFSPLDPTAVWHSHLALAIYMFVAVNFDALAQASDIRIERRQVVFLCWMQDSNPSGSQTPNRQQNECPLTNRLSYRGSS